MLADLLPMILVDVVVSLLSMRLKDTHKKQVKMAKIACEVAAFFFSWVVVTVPLVSFVFFLYRRDTEWAHRAKLFGTGSVVVNDALSLAKPCAEKIRQLISLVKKVN
jgi:hypothetical protein